MKTNNQYTPMKLTSENVKTVLMNCLFSEGEDPANHILAEGVIHRLGLHPDRVAINKENIKSMLLQLPNEFKQSGGGGYTFLNACMTGDGEQWGQQINVDELICLGLAIGMVEYTLPRLMWNMLPGGVPYFTVIDK